MGRPAHKPDPQNRRQVETLSGFGIPEPDIAGVLGVDPKTLRKHYRHELDHGHTKANAKVAENLYRKATGEGREAVIAAIFWLKTRAQWKETVVNEVSLDAGDSVKALMQRIAETGRRVHDLAIDLIPEELDAGTGNGPDHDPSQIGDHRADTVVRLPALAVGGR